MNDFVLVVLIASLAGILTYLGAPLAERCNPAACNCERHAAVLRRDHHCPGGVQPDAPGGDGRHAAGCAAGFFCGRGRVRCARVLRRPASAAGWLEFARAVTRCAAGPGGGWRGDRRGCYLDPANRAGLVVFHLHLTLVHTRRQ